MWLSRRAARPGIAAEAGRRPAGRVLAYGSSVSPIICQVAA